MTYMEQYKKRFGSYYKIIDECFVWQRALDKDGYGSFYFLKKLRRAHRVAYYFSFGDIPENMVIDHTCKNRACVNPKHLRVVTKLQNTMENSKSVGAVNKAKKLCKNGHPFDKKYGKQRYCSICNSAKRVRLARKWREEANKILC